jgi:hypothetical protein
MTGTHFPNWDDSKRGLLISAAEGVTVAATAGVIYLLTEKYEADVAICKPEEAIAPRFPAILVSDGDPWAPFAEQSSVPWGEIPFWFELYPSQSPNPLTSVPVAPPSASQPLSDSHGGRRAFERPGGQTTARQLADGYTGGKPASGRGLHRLLNELTRNEQPAPKWVEPVGASHPPCTKLARLSCQQHKRRNGVVE